MSFAYFTDVQKIYIAFYQRPADPAGLRYWAQRMEAAGGDQAAVIDAFANSAEATDLYGAINSTTIGAVVDALYLALFNRTPDAAGKKFYVDAFNAGTITAGKIALTVLNAASGDDAVSVQNKVAVANEFTQQVDGRELNDAGFGTGTAFNVTYSGNADVVAARDFLKAVTSSPSTVLNDSQITEALKTKIADATDPIHSQSGGNTFPLTDGVDNIQGTTGDDTIVAGPGSAGGVHTLGASDVLNGGTGTDKIIITSQATFVGETVVPRMTSVEQVFVQAVGAGTTTVNMINATGAQELWNDNSTGNVKITNLQEKATIGVKGGNGNNDYTVAAATAAARTGDLAIALDDANIDDLFVTKDGSNVAEGYASTTINAMGENAIGTLAVGSKLATVTVTGEGSVAVEDNLAATVRTIDASANTGGVDFNITNNTGNTTFTGGAGDDRINFGGTLDLNDKVDGGEGRDTLAVDNQNRIISNLQVSNVEVLELETLSGTLNAALIAGVDEVRVVNTLTDARGTAVVNGLTSDSTFATADGGDVQLNIKNAQVAGTNDTLNLETAMGTDTLFVQAAGVETVNYTQTDVGAVNSTVSFYDTDGVVDMEKLTIANNKGNNVNFNDLVNTIKTVDASAAMGSVNISITAGNKTNGVTITGGAGDDRLTGGDGKDIIVGGAGNDRIQGDANVGTAQITKVAVGATDVGDTYTLSINGTVVTVEATAGTGNNVEGLLAAAINGNAIITAQGITADASSGDLLINGNPNGTAFTVANTNSTNAAARAEISTIALTSGADDGDTYRVTIGSTGTAADKNYNTAFAADATPAQARAAIITTLNADAAFVGAGFTAALNGAGEIEVTGPVGNDFTLAINEQVPAAPTAQVDTITFDVADLDAGDIFTVTIGGVSANYTMTGSAGVDGVGVQNAVNAALGTTVTAAFVNKGGTAGLEANDQLTITADTAGTAFNATIKVNGAAAASTITTTTPNDPVTSLAATVTETQAALAAGANPNSPANLTVTQQQAPVLGGTAASDVLTGGEGKDTFVFIGQSSVAAGNMDTITDLNLGGAVANVGVDTIQLSAGTLGYGAFNASSLVNAGGAVTITGPTFSAALQGLFNAGGALDGALNNVGLFTYGADTYLIAANDVAGLDSNDIVIKVTGVTGTLDLSDLVIV